MDALVSIAIAAFNVERYIERCLDSCLSQTYEDIEIVVVNDGSTDTTAQIIEEYISKDNRIKVVNKENGGLISARIHGVRNCTGKYIIFLDGDDEIPVDSIKSLMSKMSEQVDIVCGSLKVIDAGNIIYKNKIISFDKLCGEKFIDYFLKNAFCNIVGNLYRKNLVELIKYPDDLDNSIGEDLVSLVQVSHLARLVVSADRCTYIYHRRESSIIGESIKSGTWARGFASYIFCKNYLITNNLLKSTQCGFLKLSITYILGYLNSNASLDKYNNDIKKTCQYAIKNLGYFVKVSTHKQTVSFGLAAISPKFVRLIIRKSDKMSSYFKLI